MNNKCIISGNNSLDKHCHENLINFDAQLLSSEERPLVELTGPNFFDCGPSFFELILWNTEIEQLLPQESMVLIIVEKL